MGPKIHFVMDADDAKVVQSLDKMRAKLQKVEAKLADVERKGKAAGRGVKGVGDKGTAAAGRLKSAFGALGGPTGPLAMVATSAALATKALAEMNAEANRGAQVLKGASDPMGALAQISKTPEQFQQRLALSRDLALGSGIEFNAAAQAVFDAQSLGISEKEIRELAPAGVLGSEFVPAMLRGGGKLREAFGAEETGPLRGIVNKAGAAALRSDTTAPDILLNALTFAPGLSKIGGSDEEGLAALGIMSGPGGKETGEAATLLRAYAKALDKAGIKGGYLAGTLALSSMSEADRTKALGGRQEAKSAYHLLSTRTDLLRERTAEVAAAEGLSGTDQSYLNLAIGSRMGSTVGRGTFKARQAELKLALAEAGTLGVERLETQTLRNELATESINSGEGRYKAQLRKGAGETIEGLGGGPEAVSNAEKFAGFSLEVLRWQLGFGPWGGGDDDEKPPADDLSQAAGDLREAAADQKSFWGRFREMIDTSQVIINRGVE